MIKQEFFYLSKIPILQIIHGKRKIYKRKSIWHLPIREISKFKETLIKQIEYKPYVYNPTS